MELRTTTDAAPSRKHESEHSTNYRQQQTLKQKLTHDAPATRTQCGACSANSFCRAVPRAIMRFATFMPPVTHNRQRPTR